MRKIIDFIVIGISYWMPNKRNLKKQIFEVTLFLMTLIVHPLARLYEGGKLKNFGRKYKSNYFLKGYIYKYVFISIINMTVITLYCGYIFCKHNVYSSSGPFPFIMPLVCFSSVVSIYIFFGKINIWSQYCVYKMPLRYNRFY